METTLDPGMLEEKHCSNLFIYQMLWSVNCIATNQRKSILGVLAVLAGVLAVLVGVLAVLVGVLGVFCIGMVYLLHEMERAELE